MIWPNKLVCVGMRFLPKEDVAALDRYKGVSADRSKAVVTLNLSLNENGVPYQGKKYAVDVLIDYKRVGYVRNQDITPEFIKKLEVFGSKCPAGYFELNQISTNYFILLAKEINTADIKGSTISSGVLANNSLATADTTYWVNNTNTKTNSTKDEKKMMNTNSMRDSFFREVKNVAIDIQSGKFGVVSSEGISVYADGGVSVNPIQDFGVKIPAFAMRVAVNDLKEGDIILSGNDASFFKAKTANGYEVVTLNGEVKQVGNVTNLFFGKNTVLAVRNMFGDSMNPLMMAMMMGDGKEFDMKTFALMSMMGGNNGGGMDSNMLMMAMLMGK